MRGLLGATIQKALRLARGQQPFDATRELMRGLAGKEAETDAAPPPDADAAPQTTPHLSMPMAGLPLPPMPLQRMPLERLPLGETLERLRAGDLPLPGVNALAGLGKKPRVETPEGASYTAHSFANAAGARAYKVYTPHTAQEGKRPCIVMLHGCTQNADDFAVGTGMNRLAEEYGLIVVYPEQPASANQMGCWNWFNHADQHRDLGEPAIIAGITREVIARMEIDEDRVFVAGLSAGGAMAEIMSVTYPDLFAAVGVHSGLAYGVASDTASAFMAMNGNGGRRPRRGADRARTIIFHGDRDAKVHPTNAELLLAEARAGVADLHRETTRQGTTNGRRYSQTIVTDLSGAPQVEYWIVEGLGHAWSGGAPEGSHTDASGPDASREMLRFFMQG